VTRRLRLAVLHARGRGQDHYWAHLWEPVSRFADARYAAFAGPADDAIVAPHVAPIDALPEPDAEDAAARTAQALLAPGLDVLVPQVATAFCRHRRHFAEVIDRVRAAGVRVVATLHNVLPHDVFPVDHGELAELYDRFDGFLVGSESQRALLLERFEVGDRPVAVARHGPALVLDRGHFDRRTARRHLGLPEEGPGVLFFGNVRPNKGLDLLLRAAPLLLARRPDAFVHVSTTAWLSEPADRAAVAARLAAFAREPGCHVRFEWIASEEIEPTFRACDVVALPYRAVSQSGILALARAFRRPVVATEPLRAEGVVPSEGRVVRADDAQAFAEGLAALLADPPSPPPPDPSTWGRHAEALERICRAVLRRPDPAEGAIGGGPAEGGMGAGPTLQKSVTRPRGSRASRPSACATNTRPSAPTSCW